MHITPVCADRPDGAGAPGPAFSPTRGARRGPLVAPAVRGCCEVDVVILNCATGAVIGIVRK